MAQVFFEPLGLELRAQTTTRLNPKSEFFTGD